MTAGWTGPAAALAAALAFSTGQAGAQQAGGGQPEPERPPFVWNVSCKPVDSGRRIGCLMGQALTLPDSGEPAVKIEIVPKNSLGNQQPLIRLSFPHGIALNAAIGVQVDSGQLFKLQLQASDRDWLYVTLPIGADMIAAMRSGKAITVSFVLTNGKLASVPISLYGFSAAYDAIVTLEGQADKP